MARVRLFTAVAVGDAVQENATLLQKQLARSGAEMKWVEAEALHVTLLFLGDVDERDLMRVCRVAADAAREEPAFPLAVAGIGAFPNLHRPKVVWAGITEGAEDLRRLFARLEAPLLEQGLYRKEDRDYTPHLTLGRVRHEQAGQAIAAEMKKHLAWTGGQTVVEELLVMSSEMGKNGPEYAVVGRGRLAEAGRR